MSTSEWRCFHCDEVFTDPGEAREHFGTRRFADTAACQLTADEVKELRALEDANEKLRIENEELDHTAGAYHAMAAELERYFGPGATTAHSAWLCYEAKEGEIEALQERIAALTAGASSRDKELTKLQQAIRGHRDARGDDRCWLDDEALYEVLPEGYLPPAYDTVVELERCRLFILNRHNPATIYESPQRAIESLEQQLAARAADFADIREKYHELILAVATKHLGETRHDTALRYIRQAEAQ